jgi:hypothetical protein
MQELGGTEDEDDGGFPCVPELVQLALLALLVRPVGFGCPSSRRGRGRDGEWSRAGVARRLATLAMRPREKRLTPGTRADCCCAWTEI